MESDNNILRELGRNEMPSNSGGLDEWISKSASNETLLSELKFLEENKSEFSTYINFDASENIPQENSTNGYRTLMFTVIGAILISLFIALYFWGFKPKIEQIQIAMLPDETKVELYDGANIALSEEYNVKTRVVNLQGSAYFHVARNEEKPFIINVKDLRIKVLGTSFTVDNGTDFLAVTVHTGKVLVYNDYQEKELTPGFTARINGSEISVGKTTEGHLISETFSHISLNQLFLELEKEYNYKFEFDSSSSLESCIYNGTFKNASIFDVLEEFKVLFNLNYSFDESIIRIHKTDC